MFIGSQGDLGLSVTYPIKLCQFDSNVIPHQGHDRALCCTEQLLNESAAM